MLTCVAYSFVKCILGTNATFIELAEAAPIDSGEYSYRQKGIFHYEGF